MKFFYYTLLFVFCSLLTNAQIFVTPNGTGDGSSWQNASGNLRDVLYQAPYGTEIWVAEGTYYPVTCSICSEEERKQSFFISSGVALYGGFKGNETQRNQRDWRTNVTRLSGDINNDNNLYNNSYSVVFTLNVDEQTILDGFTITKGSATGSAPSLEERELSGGGWFNTASAGNFSSPTVRNCIFSQNEAEGFGGGIYNFGSFSAKVSPTYTNCIFSRNNAGFDGGGLYNNGSFGGESQVMILNCEFRDNVAGTDVGSGGAIFNNGIEGNCSPIIWNSTFVRNNASLEGGVIYNQGKDGNSNPDIVNCIFYQNSASLGGVMYNLGAGGRAIPLITNCTFYDNFAESGAVIFNNGGVEGNANTDVINSIFWNNVAEKGKTFFNIYAKPRISYCLVDEKDCSSLNATLDNLSDVDCGAGIIYGVDPKFINPNSGDLELNYNSPAINKGENSRIHNMLVDVIDNPRIHLEVVDLGAMEYDGPIPTRLDTFSVHDVEGAIQLDWSTLNEYQNSGFQIQRSIDELNYESIDFVKSKGDSNEPQNYHFVDELPEAGFTNTYRLQRLDKDGCFEYSDLVHIYIEVVETGVSLFPNPTTILSNIQLTLEEESEVSIRVIDAHGKIKATPAEGIFRRGKFNIPLDMLEISAGIYYVHIIVNTRVFSYPLIVLEK